MPTEPGGTLTMLHTDVEESTLLTVHLGSRYPEILATHRTLVRAAFAAHEGHEVDTQGDSFFVVFPRATQAVAAAVAMQRALAAEAWPEGGAVRVRIVCTRGNRSRRWRDILDWTSSAAPASRRLAMVGRRSPSGQPYPRCPCG